jgi:hypothetical protein
MELFDAHFLCRLLNIRYNKKLIIMYYWFISTVLYTAVTSMHFLIFSQYFILYTSCLYGMDWDACDVIITCHKENPTLIYVCYTFVDQNL